MKIKRKILTLGISGILFLGVLFNFGIVSAYEGERIPSEMEPGTIIEYTSNNNFEIIKGGFLRESDKKVIGEKNILNQNKLAEKLLERFPNEEIYIDFNQHQEVSPVTGMKVTYADDGLVLNLEYPKGVNNPLLKEDQPTTYGPILPDGVTQVRSWGSIPNKLYVDRNTNTIFGTGRATTFSDKTGQGNHVLKKGDVATKLDSDNCKLGIGVSLEADKKSGGTLTKTMKKWDAGGMPNAIVDIWKTGVEYWGYTYKSTLSINGVSIEHANINTKGQRLY